jgi:hypothetical protein
VKPLDPDDGEWISFDGEIVSTPILHGMGTTDTFRTPDMPGFYLAGGVFGVFG